MNTLAAFAMGDMNRHKPLKTFDWNKAAKLIVEQKANVAAAGLSGDWEYTGGDIYRNGHIVTDSYTYLSSTWATPELEIDGQIIDCWIEEEGSGWSSETKWPESAIKILRGE